MIAGDCLKLNPINRNVMRNLIKFIVSFGIVCLPFFSIADCVLDNTTTPNGPINTSPTFLAGQQFLACETNNITAVQVRTITGGNIDLYLVAGNGNAITYGTPYQTFPAQSGGLVTLTLTTPFPVIGGDLYSLAVGNPSTGLDIVFDMEPVGPPQNPALPDGQYSFAYSNTNVLTLNTVGDLVFSVNIVAPPPVVIPPVVPAVTAAAIPTLSQWNLLIFGLLILNLSILFIYRLKGMRL